MVNRRKGITRRITTGEIYNVYDNICKKTRIKALTHRRVGDLISELDALGIDYSSSDFKRKIWAD